MLIQYAGDFVVLFPYFFHQLKIFLLKKFFLELYLNTRASFNSVAITLLHLNNIVMYLTPTVVCLAEKSWLCLYKTMKRVWEASCNLEKCILNTLEKKSVFACCIQALLG